MNDNIKIKVDELLELARDANTSVLVIATKEDNTNDGIDILSIVRGNILSLVASIATILSNDDDEAKRLSSIITTAVDSARDYKLNNNENELTL